MLIPLCNGHRQVPEVHKNSIPTKNGSRYILEPINQPPQWATGLDKKGILGLLDLPHFGRGQYTNSCVKQLMTIIHGGDIWLDKLILIDVEIIVHITGFPSWGMNLVQFLDEKTKEKVLVEEMNKKFCIDRGM
jgi:hypothetical protein